MTVETQKRKLTMKYAGGMVKHLGLQMYSGLVGAVAELIANAWDADSEKVAIEVPFDKDWDDIKTEITVTDFGQGMTFEECNEAYLMVGRDRRQADERDRTLVKSRRVMGRKGIGKLACFGVAKVMEVRTVKNNWLTHFRMDYTRIVNQRAGEFVTAYEPDVLFDMPIEEASGTRIILKQLQIARRQTEEQFRQSMARRFSVLSDDFLISINDIPLRRDETPFQFRYPEQGGWNEENVGGVGRIRWWAGFTQTTIKDDEARGFVVLARGKMAQAPFFFDLSGGTFGQHGMQYLTGEVEADGLDVERDVIATDRASVRWDDPVASPLLEWGQRKVRQLLSEWAESRTKDRLDNLQEKLGENKWQRLNKFAPSEQKEIMRAIRAFADIPTMDDERFAEIVDLLLRAYEDQNFMNMIRALNALTVADQGQFLQFMAEINILEAVKTASIIRARVEVVRQLKKLIDEGAPEKKASAPMDMHRILRENPWLIDPAWATLAYEQQLDTLLAEQFDVKPEIDTHTGERRLDFFCLRDSQHYVVVEVKQPKLVSGRAEIRQVEDYVYYLREQIMRGQLANSGAVVTGYLIIGKLRDEDRQYREAALLKNINVVTWSEVWRRSEQLYGEFLELVKGKVPSDDPRIQALEEI